MGASGGVMVSKLDYPTFTNELKLHWVSHLCGYVPHLNKKLCKLLHKKSGVMVNKHEEQNFSIEFEFNWMTHLYCLLLHLINKV